MNKMKRENKKLATAIFWVVLGFILVILAWAEVLDPTFFAGIGCALIIVGAMWIVQNIRYRKNPEYREQKDVEESDERNDFLRSRSWAWTGVITVLVQAIGATVAMVLGQEVIGQVLVYSVCFILVVYSVSYLVLSKKY